MNGCKWCDYKENEWLLYQSLHWSVYLADIQDYVGRCILVLKDMAEYLPDECKGMVDHLEEQERPATIIKTLLKHAKIQVDQAAKAFEHASRQQVLGESR